MKPRILSWNVRGLNKKSKCIRISNLLREWKVDISTSKKPRFMVCRVVLCTAYVVAIMWTSVVWTPVGP
jgi:hypothetical protein